jgi:hypothetical protein
MINHATIDDLLAHGVDLRALNDLLEEAEDLLNRRRWRDDTLVSPNQPEDTEVSNLGAKLNMAHAALEVALLEEQWGDTNFMFYVGGPKGTVPAARCACGANVFQKSTAVQNRVRCNGCRVIYVTEK